MGDGSDEAPGRNGGGVLPYCVRAPTINVHIIIHDSFIGDSTEVTEEDCEVR